MTPQLHHGLRLLALLGAGLVIPVFRQYSVVVTVSQSGRVGGDRHSDLGIAPIPIGQHPSIEVKTDIAAELAPQLGAALRLMDARSRIAEVRRLFTLWALSDPTGAIAYLQRMPSGKEFLGGLGAIFDVLVEVSPTGAFEFVGSLSQDRDQGEIYYVIFRELFRNRPKEAYRWLDKIPVGRGHEEAVTGLASVWSHANFDEALGWAQSLVDPAARGRALEAALSELAARDPLQAIDLAAQNLTGNELVRVMLRAFDFLAVADPKDASALVSLLPENMQREGMISVVRHLEIGSFETGLAWVETMPVGTCRNLALDHVLTKWVAQDLVTAEAYLATLNPGPARRSVAARIAGILAESDPWHAIDWAQRFTNEVDRSVLMVAIADAWVSHDPSAATRWTMASLPEDQFPEVLAYTLTVWISQDATSARDFLTSLPSTLQVTAIDASVAMLAERDPTGTLAWASSLGSRQAQEAVVEGAYLRWLRDAPVAAVAWLEKSRLPAALKQLLPVEPPAT